MKGSPNELTQLLLDWSSGNQEALDRLMTLVYDELRRLAHHHMKREAPGHILQTSALVNEAYLRLIDQKRVHWKNRAHFFGIASQLMRRILVDYARKRATSKRGGGALQVSLDDATHRVRCEAAEVLALDDALKRLADIDARQSQLVELRFFGGLTIDETAEVLELSPGTVMREWTFARAWLQREIRDEK